MNAKPNRDTRLNISDKTRNYALVGVAALAFIAVAALVQGGQPATSLSIRPQKDAGNVVETNEAIGTLAAHGQKALPVSKNEKRLVQPHPHRLAWGPDSVAAAPELEPDVPIKVSPIPMLPETHFEFRRLPQPQFADEKKERNANHADDDGSADESLRITALPRWRDASAEEAENSFDSPASHEEETDSSDVSDADSIQLTPLPELPDRAESNDGDVSFAVPPIGASYFPDQQTFGESLPDSPNHSGSFLTDETVESETVESETVESETVESETVENEAVENQPKVEPLSFVRELQGKRDFLVKQASAELPLASVAMLAEPLPAKASSAKKSGTSTKKKKRVVAAPKKGDTKKSGSGASSKRGNDKDVFKLAAQPEFGAHYVEDRPQTDARAHLIEPLIGDFSPDAIDPLMPYEAFPQQDVYEGKTLYANQRPLLELGRPWYQLGQLSPGSSVLGFHNNVTPQFLVFGDYRTGYASNRQNGNSTSQIATQLNLDFDLKLTGTERFHAFVQPLTSGGRNTRRLLDDDEMIFEGSANPAFGYFEGDLGALVGGAINKTLPFDLPFTAGIIPLVFQNGVWFEDAILGFAATLPAKNSPRFNISNMDITFFAGYDKIDSPAFQGDDSAARIMGIATFLEMLNGYIEIDYAFLDDRTFDDRSYHNISAAYTRRYGRFLSNSTRVIVNAGQNSSVVANTADGVLLLSENSLITGAPSNVVPYFNMFAGFDRPQSAARAGIAGGVLRNTGILFESDNLTGYPTLDATANDTYGMSLGVNILSGGDRFTQQLVLETSMLGVMGDDATRNANGDQYGVGFRYQLPLSNSVIFRTDGMMGFLRNDEDISGIRVELRKKF